MPDARRAKVVEVHCPQCRRAFLAPKSETSLITCCSEYLVAVIYGHIFVQPRVEEIYSEKELQEIKEWRARLEANDA